MSENTLSHRAARRLVVPLLATPITPNHLTTARLLTGLVAIGAFALGTDQGNLWGGILFIISTFLDRADGELARLSGKTSVAGHRYDINCDVAVVSLLFLGIGIGARDGHFAEWGTVLGFFASATILCIYRLSSLLEREQNLDYRTPVKVDRWLDPDDLLYVVGPIAWLGLLPGFLTAAVVGAPIYALWMLRQYHRFRIGVQPGEKLTSNVPTGLGEPSAYLGNAGND